MSLPPKDLEESMQPVIELTADGSHTLFVPALNEHYHSVNGAIQEAVHIFLKAGLDECLKEEPKIFEVGFGTGLNAFLTAKYAQEIKRTIDYTSIEAFPVQTEILDHLNYTHSDGELALFQKLHQVEWETACDISTHFRLTKLHAKLEEYPFKNLKNQFDLIFFDAFAPDVQDYLWSQEVFDHMYYIAREDAILVTYCAKGVVRRRMQAAGFTVERIPGPPGKREMLRARKL